MKTKEKPIDKLKDGIDIKFTVDAALLSELGERLVGKPHVALGELIKNSYDADATEVIINFGDDMIEIIDNGHGMNFEEFESYWMRVGSQHKQIKRYSKKFKRPMTGSKGIGRLAVQFLAKEIGMRTVSIENQKSEIHVYMNWAEAQKAGDLTEANARYKTIEPSIVYPGKEKHGTAIILNGLNQTWNADSITELAKEIWPLQPPFRTVKEGMPYEEAFKVKIDAPHPEAVKHFENQMEAVLDIWDAKLNGRLEPSSSNNVSKVNLILEFRGGEKLNHEYVVPHGNLNSVEFEIRIFTLRGKQPLGIIVDDAREYFRKFGGVHVYDSGFRMPFYGTVEGDWLRIQYDQASRRHKSALLPEDLQVFRGLQYLPTLSRTFGVVHVDTARERKLAEEKGIDEGQEFLQIQITRDRLVENSAHETLRNIVRYSMDYYAIQEAARQYSKFKAIRPTEPVIRKFERVEEVLNRYKRDIPRPVYRNLSIEIKGAASANQSEQERITRQAGLLGALATTGMSALAYEHETKKHHFRLLELSRSLSEIVIDDLTIKKKLDNIVKRLNDIINQSRSLRAVFSPMLEEENRMTVGRFKASRLIRDACDQLTFLLHGIRPTFNRVDNDLLLPEAGYAEWNAIFQNILLNAVNSMLDKETKKIDISSIIEGDRRTLLIQDTGIGVNLATAEELFKPFVRKIKVSPERKALGVGGAGLGLTIVRMLTDNIGCNVSFKKPEDGFATSFQIQWRETKS